MNTGTAQLYKVAVPSELLDELEAAMRDAAAEAGQTSAYTATRLDPHQTASELQFDPITPMVVLKFVLESAAAALIGKAVEKLIKKIASRPDPAVRIIVMYPDGEVETINTADVRQTRAAVDRLLGSGG